MTTIAAAGATALLGDSALPLQAADTARIAAKPARGGVVDVHHHFWSPEYLKAQTDWEGSRQGGRNAVPAWSPTVSLEAMDKAGVQTAVLSLASISGGFWGLTTDDADRIVRASIDYAQKLMSNHPRRFGLFAPLSMIDADSSLRQIEYALDYAKADGIGLQSSYSGRYPGHLDFKPIWEELNRRGAIVAFHGPVPECCSTLGVAPGAGATVIEVTFDMTRAALSLLLSGALARYERIRWILAYGGGTLPFLAGRIAAFINAGKVRGVEADEVAPEGIHSVLSKLYYDTVNVTEEASWKALTTFVPASQILYGTDFPYFDNRQLEAIDSRTPLPKTKDLVLSGNAKRLIPRLANA